MVLKRFSYEGDVDILAPLKCGTRWLEEHTNPISIKEEWLGNNTKHKFKENTYWVYRDGRNHLESALNTEIRNFLEFNTEGLTIETITTSYLAGDGTHWSPIIFLQMYRHWNRHRFKIIELKDLSNIFPDIEFDSSNYNFNDYKKSTNDKSIILELVDKLSMNKLYDMVECDMIYLNKILNKERRFT
jgi:hypothetical protein